MACSKKLCRVDFNRSKLSDAQLNKALEELNIAEGQLKDAQASKQALAHRSEKIAHVASRLVASNKRFEWVDSNIEQSSEKVRYLEILKEVTLVVF